MVVVAPGVVLADTTILYEDFSSDPGWDTDLPDKFYWNSTSSNLFAYIDNQPPESPYYTPNRYIVTETDLDPTKSFRLTWDMKMNGVFLAGKAIFGLYSSDLISQNRTRSGLPQIVSDSTINIQLLEIGTRGREINIIQRDKTDIGEGGIGGPNIFSNGTWYEMGIEYDTSDGTVRTWAQEKVSGEIYFERIKQTTLSEPFSPDMRYLGISMYPDGESETVMSEPTRINGHSVFEIDNVELLQIEEDVEEEPIDPLLLQYAPILYFHEDEEYYPMNVESFIEDSGLWSTKGIKDTLLLYEEELTVAEFTDIVENEDTADYYLAYSDPDNAKSIDLDEARAKYTNAIESGRATSTVYVHKMTDGYTDSFGNVHSFIVLQYWFFYAMNNWKEVGGRNNHEGDWESVFVFLDAETEEPEYVAYSSHVNDGDPDVIDFQYDSVRRKWSGSDVEKDGIQGVNFVSLGSHANYPNNGLNGTHKVDLVINDETSINGRHLRVGDYVVVELDLYGLRR